MKCTPSYTVLTIRVSSGLARGFLYQLVYCRLPLSLIFSRFCCQFCCQLDGRATKFDALAWCVHDLYARNYTTILRSPWIASKPFVCFWWSGCSIGLLCLFKDCLFWVRYEKYRDEANWLLRGFHAVVSTQKKKLYLPVLTAWGLLVFR